MGRATTSCNAPKSEGDGLSDGRIFAMATLPPDSGLCDCDGWDVHVRVVLGRCDDITHNPTDKCSVC